MLGVWFNLFIFIFAVRIQDAKFTKKEQDEEWENKGEKPEGFEWEANGVGRISVTPHVTDVECTVEGYTFKAHLTKEVLIHIILSPLCSNVLPPCGATLIRTESFTCDK